MRRILKEKGYDGIIYQNGFEGDLSVTAFYSDQIHTVSENGIDVDSDKRYSLPYGEETDEDTLKYSYEALVDKGDVSVVTLPAEIPQTADGKVDKKAILARGKLNARKQKNPNNTDTDTYVRVDDIGLDVLLSKNGMTHGIARSQETAFAVMKIGDMLKNSVAVNELNGSTTRKTEMSYVPLGACRDSENIYAVRSVVSKLKNDVTEIDVYQLSAVKGKKTETPNSALKRGAAVTEQSSLISSGSPVIRIADFLQAVKEIPLINEIFSEDVATKLGVTRYQGTLSEDIRYALPYGEETDEDFAEISRALKEEILFREDEAFDAEKIVDRGSPRTSRNVTMTVGQLKKLYANNKVGKVYSKKDALSVVNRFVGIGDLTQKTRGEIADAVWQILNESADYDMISKVRPLENCFLKTISESLMTSILILIKRTELLRRNLLQRKPLQILRILLGSITAYHKRAQMSIETPIFTERDFQTRSWTRYLTE